MRGSSLALILGLCLIGCQKEKESPTVTEQPAVSPGTESRAPSEPSIKERNGGLDVTFLVASDTHIGYQAPDDPFRDPLARPHGIEKTNLRMIESMNSIAGKKLPSPLGASRIDQPRGVLISGDLTENGGKEEWALWKKFFDKGGPLKVPVYEGAGNHDRVKNWHIREQVKKRHGGRHYYFDWDDLRVVCLGEAPDESALEVLEEAFTTAEKDVPFVLFFHYPLQGPFSDNWFTRAGGQDKFEEAIEGHRVLGIFHGHYHATGGYRWRGHDVYNVGSPKYVHHSYSIVHITDDVMKVAEWDYDRKAYSWWHQKSVSLKPNAKSANEVVGVSTSMDVKPEFSLKPRATPSAN